MTLILNLNSELLRAFVNIRSIIVVNKLVIYFSIIK